MLEQTRVPVVLGVSLLKLLEVGCRVRIEQNAAVIHRHLQNILSVAPEDCSASDVTRQLAKLRKNGAVNENRVSAKASVDGNGDLGPVFGILRDEMVHCRWLDERLIGQNHQDTLCLRVQAGETRAQRGSHAVS